MSKLIAWSDTIDAHLEETFSKAPQHWTAWDLFWVVLGTSLTLLSLIGMMGLLMALGSLVAQWL